MIRYRGDGGHDLVASVDAFKITRHRDSRHAWKVSPLTPWARDLIADARCPMPDKYGGLWDPETNGRSAYFQTKTAARDWLTSLANAASEWWS